jgi:formylglycine-generating enzyme required for sulfatase activity
MTNSSHNEAAFYCLTHQVRFYAIGQAVIQCDRSAHAIGQGFPNESVWAYCCDCATFWPYEPTSRGSQLTDCLVCERQIVRRYLCNSCQVISVESNALVRRKAHSIDTITIQPHCPGCRSASIEKSVEHHCAETSITFLSARSTCPLCRLQIVPTATQPQEETQRRFCRDCSAELTAPFRFCKRCGKPQSIEIPQDFTNTDLMPPDDESEEPRWASEEDDTADLTWEQTDPDSLTTPSDFSREATETHDAGETNEESNLDTTTPYVSSWSYPEPHLPPKRRTPWLIGGVAVLLSVGILLAVVATNSNRGSRRSANPTPPRSDDAPSAPPGMVYISGGEFIMGTDAGDEYEKPAHKVKVAPFYVDITEVTCEDYLKFIKEKGHRAPRNWVSGTYLAGASKQPVTGIDWNDAKAYADWAGKRLPTEEEWEFVARGGSGTTYPWGNEWRPNVANAGESSAHHLVNVASYPNGKTSAGVLDIIGNAWEWTASDVVAYPGGHLSSQVPRNVKVIRGGSWQETSKQSTATYRGFLRATDAEDYSATGFRCVRDVKLPPASPSQ